MEDRFLINAIYLATEGEGVLIGTPQVFVRFQGCAVGCINCDSKDTWAFDDEMHMPLDEIIRQVKEASLGKVKRVSITGGDPLHPKHEKAVLTLAKALKRRGYSINIEAAGTRAVHEIFDICDFISFDYKTPSTGVRTKSALIAKMAEQYPNRFQVKAVIEDELDFYQTLNAYNEVIAQTDAMNFPWVLTPAYIPGEDFPMDRFLMVIDLNSTHGGMFRVIGQQHKWLFGPDEKNV